MQSSYVVASCITICWGIRYLQCVFVPIHHTQCKQVRQVFFQYSCRNPNIGGQSGCSTDGVCDWTNYEPGKQILKSFEIPLRDQVAYRAEFSHFWNNHLPKQLVTFTGKIVCLQFLTETYFRYEVFLKPSCMLLEITFERFL